MSRCTYIDYYILGWTICWGSRSRDWGDPMSRCTDINNCIVVWIICWGSRCTDINYSIVVWIICWGSRSIDRRWRVSSRWSRSYSRNDFIIVGCFTQTNRIFPRFWRVDVSRVECSIWTSISFTGTGYNFNEMKCQVELCSDSILKITEILCRFWTTI